MSPSVQPSSAHRQSGVHPAFTLAWCDEVVAAPSHPKAGVAGAAPGAPPTTRPAEASMERVAVGIQAWSSRQRGLAETLAGLRLPHIPGDRSGLSVHLRTNITASASVRPNPPAPERDVSLDDAPVALGVPSATFVGDKRPTLPPFSLLLSSASSDADDLGTGQREGIGGGHRSPTPKRLRSLRRPPGRPLPRRGGTRPSAPAAGPFQGQGRPGAKAPPAHQARLQLLRGTRRVARRTGGSLQVGAGRVSDKRVARSAQLRRPTGSVPRRTVGPGCRPTNSIRSP